METSSDFSDTTYCSVAENNSLDADLPHGEADFKIAIKERIKWHESGEHELDLKDVKRLKNVLFARTKLYSKRERWMSKCRKEFNRIEKALMEKKNYEQLGSTFGTLELNDMDLTNCDFEDNSAVVVSSQLTDRKSELTSEAVVTMETESAFVAAQQASSSLFSENIQETFMEISESTKEDEFSFEDFKECETGLELSLESEIVADSQGSVVLNKMDSKKREKIGKRNGKKVSMRSHAERLKDDLTVPELVAKTNEALRQIKVFEDKYADVLKELANESLR